MLQFSSHLLMKKRKQSSEILATTLLVLYEITALLFLGYLSTYRNMQERRQIIFLNQFKILILKPRSRFSCREIWGRGLFLQIILTKPSIKTA